MDYAPTRSAAEQKRTPLRSPAQRCRFAHVVEDEFLDVFAPEAEHLSAMTASAQQHGRNAWAFLAASVSLHPIERDAEPLGDFTGIEQALRGKGEN
jgi:hypothetical protein